MYSLVCITLIVTILILKNFNMSDADWDAEDFEPQQIKPTATTDKWEGEDEDDHVKDSWDAEEDEEKPESLANSSQVQPKKKTSSKDKLDKRKSSSTLVQNENNIALTPEELNAEKLRRQKLQEDSDLELAKEAFGVVESCSVDACEPSTSDDFDVFRKVLTDKIGRYEASPHFMSFLETLFRDLSLNLDAEDIKKLGGSLNVLSMEKARAAKAAASKPKSKKGPKKLQIGKAEDYDDSWNYDELGDFI